MRTVKLFGLPLAAAMCLALLASCANTPAPATTSDKSEWFDADELKLVKLLPLVPDAAATRAELDAMLRFQLQRTEAQCARAREDAKKDLARFAPALGLTTDIKDPRLAGATRILARLRDVQESITNKAKDATDRPRPFLQDRNIQTCIERPLSASYPSGHAAWGMAAALLLADMVPERRAELLARGQEFGEARVVGGVHFPTDTAAGRTSGTLIAAFLLASPRYEADAAAASAGLRAVLGLPARP